MEQINPSLERGCWSLVSRERQRGEALGWGKLALGGARIWGCAPWCLEGARSALTHVENENESQCQQYHGTAA